jgi:hypothetical protein
MHTLHDYVAKQLADKLKSRRVVVWFDERGEFQPFVDEVRGGPRTVSEPVPVAVAGGKARLAEYAGSMFELRAVVEPHVSGDEPDAMVVYVPGLTHDPKASVLMELEKAGYLWRPRLRQHAREVLLRKYTLGIVDEMLPDDRRLCYLDLARAAAGNSGAEPPSILKGIFHDASGNDGLLTAWLVSDARDAEIVNKQATQELIKLVKARLGLELGPEASLAKSRAITLRYVLASEFRLDLSCEPPASLGGVAKPPTKSEEAAVREIARRLRAAHADAYGAIADRVETELGLKDAKLPSGSLGSIDTFRFEERELLRHAGDLILRGEFDEALALVGDREQSFWLDREIGRKAQWEATRRMAELGHVAGDVLRDARAFDGGADAWVLAYFAKNGWHRLDLAQRGLEAWVAKLDEEPDERTLAVVRRAYEDACQAMAVGFSRALGRAGWAVPGALQQSRIWSEVVAHQPKPVAYFLVDAMRFEMGAELTELLAKTAEVSLRAAVGSLPSITPIGMAALQPGASSSFSVCEQGGKLGARIDGTFLPDLAARKKYAAARVPTLVDLPLDELLSLQPSKLAKKIDGAQVIIVRSQEIDQVGEAGFIVQARQVMDSMISNLARGVRKLAAARVEYAVVTADHGHLFYSADRDDSMKIDSPGGTTVELHRRCWIGRGGSTPASCVRVAGSALGYDTDLDFVFPSGLGVFRSGGDLAYHHGGPTLQELVIPVLTVRSRVVAPPTIATPVRVRVTVVPEKISNRVFSVVLNSGEQQMSLGGSALEVRPLLVADGKHVGSVGMVVDAALDRASGCVTIEPGRPATVVFLLDVEGVASVRVVVQEPLTDAELYRSLEIPVQLGV